MVTAPKKPRRALLFSFSKGTVRCQCTCGKQTNRKDIAVAGSRASFPRFRVQHPKHCIHKIAGPSARPHRPAGAAGDTSPVAL